MLTLRRSLLIALLIAGTTQLRADGINNPQSGGSGGGQVGFIEGVNNLGVGGSSSPTTPCVGGQLDFSDVTGCNTTLYMVILR